jgi:ferritin-like metal-binding protein YciE
LSAILNPQEVLEKLRNVTINRRVALVTKAWRAYWATVTELLKGESHQGVRDAGLIAAAQRVEHHEMAGYGSARTYAEMPGDSEAPESLLSNNQRADTCHTRKLR